MDRLNIELQVHRKEILTKLITIMQYQLEVQLERLETIPEPSASQPLTEEHTVKPSPLARKRGPRRSEQLACDAQDLLPALQALLEPRAGGGKVREDLLAPLRAVAQPS
eukprot:jgi/Pico_ML_1/54175/g4587.t1